MTVAFACIRTPFMYKCSKIGICLESAQNVKSQQYSSIILNLNKSKNSIHSTPRTKLFWILHAIARRNVVIMDE